MPSSRSRRRSSIATTEGGPPSPSAIASVSRARRYGRDPEHVQSRPVLADPASRAPRPVPGRSRRAGHRRPGCRWGSARVLRARRGSPRAFATLSPCRTSQSSVTAMSPGYEPDARDAHGLTGRPGTSIGDGCRTANLRPAPSLVGRVGTDLSLPPLHAPLRGARSLCGRGPPTGAFAPTPGSTSDGADLRPGRSLVGRVGLVPTAPPRTASRRAEPLRQGPAHGRIRGDTRYERPRRPSAGAVARRAGGT